MLNKIIDNLKSFSNYETAADALLLAYTNLDANARKFMLEWYSEVFDGITEDNAYRLQEVQQIDEDALKFLLETDEVDFESKEFERFLDYNFLTWDAAFDGYIYIAG